MEKKPFVINVKKPEDSPKQIAEKLNTLHGAIDISVINGALPREEFDTYKGKLEKTVDGYESRINYNIEQGRKRLADLRYHGAGLTSVVTDSTLTGNGTTASPLHATTGNGTVTSVAALTLGTTGTDLSSTVASGTTTPVITLQVPTASATNRGALSSTDWSTFNNKQATGNYITALTGDVTATGPNSVAATLATVNATAGTFGSATQASVVTVNGKGLATSVSNITITPAVGSITGLGTGVSTALGVNVGSAGAFVTFNGALGTPSSGVLTNVTGTAAALSIGGSAATATTSTTATNATNTAITDDTTTNATMYPTWVTTASGNQAQKVSSSKLSFNPSTGTLTATNHVGTFAGNTFTTGTGVLTIAASKTLTANNSITLAGTDSTTFNLPSTTATAARIDAGQTFTGVQVMTSPSITTANLTGTQLLAENASLGLDPAGSADGKYTGITVTATAGYTQAFGDLVYLDPTDSRWEATDANSAAGADGDARGLLGMVVVAGTDGNACTVLLNGIIRADAKFPTFTVNNPIYVSETAGLVTQTQPTTTDVVIRVLGAALTTDEMYFSPSYDYITHT